MYSRSLNTCLQYCTNKAAFLSNVSFINAIVSVTPTLLYCTHYSNALPNSTNRSAMWDLLPPPTIGEQEVTFHAWSPPPQISTQITHISQTDAAPSPSRIPRNAIYKASALVEISISYPLCIAIRWFHCGGSKLVRICGICGIMYRVDPHFK